MFLRASKYIDKLGKIKWLSENCFFFSWWQTGLLLRDIILAKTIKVFHLLCPFRGLLGFFTYKGREISL